VLIVFYVCQDMEREMQMDLARQLEQLNKEMDEQLLVDLQVRFVSLSIIYVNSK